MNNNCDGSGPHASNPEVRVLRTSGQSNMILCFNCYLREIGWRREANKHVCHPFDLPEWRSLNVYQP